MIHVRIPIAYDFLGPKGSMISQWSYCDGRLTPGDGNY